MATDEKKRSRKKQLYHDIVKQVEFYFSPSNLSKDRFMFRVLAENSNGIELEVLMTFNKLKSLTTDIGVLTKALRLSECLELTENETRVKSKVEIKPKENEDDCTIYVERLPLDVNVDFMHNVFSHFGKIDYVSLPKFQNGKLKGFGFVEFADPSSANQAIEEFKKTGSYLPIDMAPGNLRSICTFDKKAKEKFLQSKHKMFDYDDCSNSRVDEEMSMLTDEIENIIPDVDRGRMENLESEDNDKKRKHKTSPSTLERKMKKVKSDDDEIEDERKATDSSNSKSENVSDQPTPVVDSEKEVETLENNSVPKLVEQESNVLLVNENACDQFRNQDNNEMSDQIEDNLDDKMKKKRRQKKKPKKDRPAASSGLLILSKADWKKLRNKYLNLQWEKMRSLKKHLHKCKQRVETHSNVDQFNNGFGISSFVEIPRSVLKITMEEPVVDIKVFKADLRSKGKDIVNIDVKEGSTEVHVRFSSAESALGFQANNTTLKTQIITGEDEERYWAKIYRDREYKKGRKTKKMEVSDEQEENKDVGAEEEIKAKAVEAEKKDISTEDDKPVRKGLKDKPSLNIIPGTVVKINTPEPIINIKQFKNDVKKSCQNIVYVDAVEGCCEAFARLKTADSAKLFTSDTSFGQVNLLSGKEEQLYWNKINEDRTNKFNKNVRINKRGKQKIIKKAEKIVGKHILFEDTDDMIVSHTG